MTLNTSHSVERIADLTDQDFLAPDGRRWTMAATLGERTLFADTASDLLADMLPGYPRYVAPHTDPAEDLIEASNAEEERAVLMRWEHACQIATEVQALLCNDAVVDGRFDPANETEETLTAIFSDKRLPVVGVDYWEHSVPLVLVASHYAPTTHLAPPAGRGEGQVLWVDPSDEMAYLRSLDGLGVIGLHVHDETATQPA